MPPECIQYYFDIINAEFAQFIVIIFYYTCQANPRYYDRVEDLTELLHLNESSVLHVLRQRYGASLVHTFAGRHLIVINPMRQLASSYSDKV